MRVWKLPAKVKAVTSLLLLFVAVYFVLRLVFFLMNTERFAHFDPLDIIFAFVHGVRFDLYAIVWLNIPVLLSILAFPNKWQLGKIYRRAVLTYLFFVNCFLIGFNVGDWEFFNFSGKRTTLDIFFLAEDIGNTGFELITFYWQEFLLGLAVYALVFLGIVRWMRSYQQNWLADSRRSHCHWFLCFFTLVLLVLMSRGGWQLKPIRPVNAYAGVPQELGALVLNTTFTMLRSKGSGNVQPLKFFKTEQEVIQVLQPEPPKRPDYFADFKGFNVVVIILESFSLEYTGLQNLGQTTYTPFLDELAKKPRARVLRYHFSNGRKSIDAVPSLLAGLPTLMAQPFVASNYQTNEVVGWGRVLQDLGYKTAFFHGAQNGSMFFDSFSAQAGFENYYGLNEYPNPQADTDGTWGIFDEPFFHFMNQQLSEWQQPFASVFFSLSSHHPYTIPQKYKGKFPTGPLTIHESIGYTDYALKTFFEEAKTKSWFQQTLFFITADHTSKTLHPESQTEFGAFRVPMVIYAPGKDLPPVSDKVFSQHLDLPKTIYNLLGAQPEKAAVFGADVFALPTEQSSGEVYNFSYPGYWYLSREGFYRFDDEGRRNQQKIISGWPMIPQATEISDKKAGQRMRAWLQYYRNGLMKNNWYLKAESQP